MINKTDLLDSVARYFSRKVSRELGDCYRVKAECFSPHNQETCVITVSLPVFTVNVEDIKNAMRKATEIEDITVSVAEGRMEIRLKNAYSLYLRQMHAHFGLPYLQEKNRLVLSFIITCILALFVYLIT